MSSTTVIVVGPSPQEIGGMAEAVRQLTHLDLAPKFDLQLFATTQSPNASEPTALRFIRHIRHVARLRSFCGGHRAGIAHIHTCSGFSLFRSAVDLIVLRRAGWRTLLHVHGASFDKFHDGSGRIGRAAIRSTLRLADGVIALSAHWRSYLLAITPTARVFIIENAVEVPNSPRTQVSGNPCRFLLLARMDRWKGVDDLLDACAILRRGAVPFALELAGPPGSAGDAQELARKIHDRSLSQTVRYLGPVQGEQKEKLLARTDILVIPSHHEGMPLVMLEALARGIPVLATKVGAIPEVLTDGRQGRLVEAHRPELLAAAMKDLSSDPRGRLAMSRAARELALQRFTMNRLRVDYESVYSLLLQSSSARGVLANADARPRVPATA